MQKRQTSGFPRVQCLAPDCQRGTTRIRPNEDGDQDEWICGDHWRRVPKSWKSRLSLFRRRYFAAERKADEATMQRASHAYWNIWARIKRSLQSPESEMVEGMPAIMLSELRRDGLI